METMTMKRKLTGRPAKVVKREVRACIRFTRPEYFIIREKAAKAGMTASAYLRQIAICTRVDSRLSDEERHFVRQLIGMANNLNQIAKCCHVEGALKAMVYFETYRAQVDEILKKLK
jgi:hypothetical protein